VSEIEAQRAIYNEHLAVMDNLIANELESNSTISLAAAGAVLLDIQKENELLSLVPSPFDVISSVEDPLNIYPDMMSVLGTIQVNMDELRDKSYRRMEIISINVVKAAYTVIAEYDRVKNEYMLTITGSGFEDMKFSFTSTQDIQISYDGAGNIIHIGLQTKNGDWDFVFTNPNDLLTYYYGVDFQEWFYYYWWLYPVAWEANWLASFPIA